MANILELLSNLSYIHQIFIMSLFFDKEYVDISYSGEETAVIVIKLLQIKLILCFQLLKHGGNRNILFSLFINKENL